MKNDIYSPTVVGRREKTIPPRIIPEPFSASAPMAATRNRNVTNDSVWQAGLQHRSERTLIGLARIRLIRQSYSISLLMYFFRSFSMTGVRSFIICEGNMDMNCSDPF
ncbi:hypothetical protein AVEN_244958-1 [Araneus ventricosus]|uniref:Uncharacterized protein n=1 Tax=Araneus ventricosus TaxID=182803 RepID=A0A4Y2RUB7_ARAVE|nr:hypothetical protein AVEN_244958-1 [Araneus ventricosus]